MRSLFHDFPMTQDKNVVSNLFTRDGNRLMASLLQGARRLDGRPFEDAEELTTLAQTLGPKLEYLPVYPRRTNVQAKCSRESSTVARS